MQRRSLLLMAPLLPLGLFVSRYLKALAPGAPPPIDYQEKAIRLSQLAAGIHTAADARLFVDFVADLFSEQLPPAAASSGMREMVAHAEFAAVSNRQMLITEPRVAKAWNAYAQTIQAPQECHVTDAEVHNLRDAFLSTARLFWERGDRNIWSVPAIYATRADGGIDVGCRAIEAIRIFWDLANIPDNLASARVRVNQGVLISEQIRQAQERPSTTAHRSYVSGGPATRNPVEVAAREYVARNGMKAFGTALSAMLDQALV
jgi:hypothetical protein